VHKLVLLLLALLAVSCVTPERGAEKKLVGEWRYADKIQSCQYRFASDRTFAGEVVYRGRKVSQFAGRWTVRRDKLLYEYTSDALGTIAPGSTDSDQLVAVADDHFEIEAADGSRRRYSRVQ
jgi:hypothetical protein